MRRVIGDVYAIQLPDNRVGFMQHLANDSSQLGSNVVCVFRVIQAQDSPVDLAQIVQADIEFYAHVLLKAGETLGIWNKVGRANKAHTSLPLWCKCIDSDRTIAESKNWKVWRTDGLLIPAVLDSRDFLEAEIGIVFSPLNIQARLINGQYPKVYPRKPQSTLNE